jgi:TRAP-type C4-dicarboxylate transport system permease small subunit
MPFAESVVSAIRITVRTAQIMSAICLLSGIVLNFINVVGRYFFLHAIIWAEETMLFLMIASVFLGAGAITLRGAHIRMDLAVQLMSPRVRILLDIVAQVTFVVMAAVLIWLAYPVIAQYVAFGQVSDALRLPVAIPHSVIPIGLFIMALAVIARLIERKWRFVDSEGV